jgi:hypothetical protein
MRQRASVQEEKGRTDKVQRHLSVRMRGGILFIEILKGKKGLDGENQNQ